MEQEVQMIREKAQELQRYFESTEPLVKKLTAFLDYHKSFKLHATSCVYCGQFLKPSPTKCITGYTLGSAINKSLFELEEEYDKQGATENGAFTNKAD